jgi:RNA polymerase sigma factor (sigma-70 family)
MEDHEDISQLRTDPKAWDRKDVWEKLWGSAVMKASQRLKCVSPGYVEDIAIESITKVIEELPRYQEIRTFGELRAFTTVAADRRALSHLRKIRLGDGDASPEPPIDVMTPEVRLQIKDCMRAIASIFEKLKPEKRNLLYDRHLHGLSYQEIADNHNMPVGNVGNNIKRALEEVTKWLQDNPKLCGDIRLSLGFHIWLLLLFLS